MGWGRRHGANALRLRRKVAFGEPEPPPEVEAFFNAFFTIDYFTLNYFAM